MASEKSRAIVLRVVEFSETSCIVTLFTEDFGKLGALAKGARRPKSPFEGALDLLALIRIVFLHKSSEALDLLTEARLERRFHAAQRDLARLYAGYYVAELLAELTDASDPHRELFAAAEETLFALDHEAAVPETLLRFEWTALKLVGHQPSLDRCAVCGQTMTIVGNGRVAFGLVSGGLLCSECRPGRRGVVSVSSAALAAMRQAGLPVDASQPLVIEPSVRGELRSVMKNYFAHLVGRRLRMSEYLTNQHARPEGRV